MWRVALIALMVLSASACAPHNNPIIAFGKEANTATVPLQEYKVYFKENLRAVYDALLVAGNRNDLTISDAGAGSFVVLIDYDYSFTKNVWGGQFRVGLDSVGETTRLSVSFYEKSTYVINSILNPLVDDMKVILESSGASARQKAGG